MDWLGARVRKPMDVSAVNIGNDSADKPELQRKSSTSHILARKPISAVGVDNDNDSSFISPPSAYPPNLGPTSYTPPQQPAFGGLSSRKPLSAEPDMNINLMVQNPSFGGISARKPMSAP